MKNHLLLTLYFLIGALIAQAQWQNDVRLTNDPGMSSPTAYSNARCIASNGDTVHVVWSDNRVGGNYEIFYKRSVDGGLSWGPDLQISNNVYFSSNPSVSVSGSVVIVVWDDNRDGVVDGTNYEIYYNRSTDGGTSWGTDTRLTNDVAASQNPCVSVSSSLVIVTWNDNRQSGPGGYFIRSTDGGMNWGSETFMGGTWNSAVSVSGQIVHAVWTDGRGMHPCIYYKRSTDGGTTWGADMPLTINDIAYSDSPSLSVSGLDVHIAYRDSRNSTGTGYEIFHKHSTDGGITWNPDTQLTNFSVTTYNPSVSVSGSGVHVVWTDNHEGNFEIYYDRSQDGGQSWEAVTRLTNNAALSFYPFVAASHSAVHVIWEENRDGNFEIYYKRNPTGNTVGITGLPFSGILFTIFPNPSSSEIIVRSLENINELFITTIEGREIYHTRVLNPTLELPITTNDFPGGIYFIQIKAGNWMSTQKLIKL
jgi:hypothetical protein